MVVLVGPGEDRAASPEQAEAALTDALERVGPAAAASRSPKPSAFPAARSMPRPWRCGDDECNKPAQHPRAQGEA